jgi:hypothetical protein
MKNSVIKFNGQSYIRDVEMIGDIEKIKWFIIKSNLESEIFEQDELLKLEDAYEDYLLDFITPMKPII